MAKVNFDIPPELFSQVKKLESGAPAVMKAMVEAGMKVVVSTLKLNTPSRSGDLRRSIHTTGGHADSYGNWYDNVHFGSKDYEGYDRKGTPNALKANVLESGRKDGTRKGRHFLRKSMKSAQGAAEEAMQKTYEERTGIK